MRMGSLMLFIKWRLVLGVFAGAALGLGWYKLVGCGTGTCPTTARWWTSTGCGALMGFLMARGG